MTLRTIISGCCLLSLSVTSALADVTVIERPETSQRNQHYVSNRAPLQPSAFVKLPVGSIRPEGWLKEVLHRQRDGLTGHLGRISAWLQKDDNAWLDADGRGKWGWEELPYWLKGYANLGYILQDEDIVQEAEIWLNGAINSQREDGEFGPARGKGRHRDYWGNMIMLYCLQSWHEYSGDPRVLELMTRYFRFQLEVPDDELLESYWQRLRGGDNLHSILWLYNRTGDPFLLELAEKMHHNTSDWSSRGHDFGVIGGRKHKRPGTAWPSWYGDLIDWHNVNIAQAFREPAQYWQLSGQADDLQATYENFHLVRRMFGQVPGGMFGGDENCRPGYDDPRQGIETCGLVEQLNSDEHLLRITGDSFWADHAEEVAFNSLPAATMPDMKSLRYLTAPNMVLCDAHSHAPGIDNNGPFLIMNPFSSRCCQHNHAQGWPYYAENCWMATPDNGLLAALYTASEVTAKVGDTGQQVSISQQTHYPFEEQIRLTVTSGSATFPLYLRIPDWCDAASVSINGSQVISNPATGHYVRINRQWQQGDTVVLELPMRLRLQEWEQNHNSVSISHGPLTYSLKIDEKVIARDSAETAIGDSQWQQGADPSQWPSYELHADSPWNYGLDLGTAPLTSKRLQELFQVTRVEWPQSNYPFTTEDVPVRITTTARRIPEWTLDQYDLAGELQDSPVRTTQPAEQVQLIPMGAARLRISSFPVAGQGNDAVAWIPSRPQAQFSVSASHTFSGDTVTAIADGLLPVSSGDQAVPRHTFWGRKGTQEWIQADFDTPRTVAEVGVYWFDDTGRGQCRVPASWTLMYQEDDTWKPVETQQPFGTSKDQLNRVAFAPVTTAALKLMVQLSPGVSGGVLELVVSDTPAEGAAASPSAPQPERWSVEKANAWYDSIDWPVGANFVPSTAINQLEMWQAETWDPKTIDRELKWASDIGMNTMRVYLHDIPWRQDADGYLQRIDEYLSIADRHGIRTMFVIWDSVWHPHPQPGKQPDPVPGLHNSGWVQSPGIDILNDSQKQDELKPYVQGLLTRFRDDPRILAWDLFNEPENTNGNSYGPHSDTPDLPAKIKAERAAELIRKTFEWAREINPVQPLTVGVWTGAGWASNPQGVAALSLELSDIITFHSYSNAHHTSRIVERLQEYDRPLICTEYMARSAGSTFETILPLYQEHRVGAINWGLVAGRSGTIYPWSSWNKPFDREPDPWFHDVFRSDGTPYSRSEVDFIRDTTAEEARLRSQEGVFVLPYFLGNGETGVYLTASHDGLKFDWLNDGKPVLPAPNWPGENLTRDPSILYRNGVFHMVWTTSWKSRSIGYAWSRNLIDWSVPQKIDIWGDRTDVRNTWAPELHWDPEQREYLILWSTTTDDELSDNDGTNNPHQLDHRSYASRTRDFRTFTEPRLFYSTQDPELSVIDPYITHDNRNTPEPDDDRWVMVIKNEMYPRDGGKNLRLVFAEQMQGPYETTLGPAIVGAGTDIVDRMGEGPSLLKVDQEWWLYWDAPGSEFSYCLATSPDLQTWTNRSADMSLPVDHMRHGTVLRVPKAAVFQTAP